MKLRHLLSAVVLGGLVCIQSAEARPRDLFGVSPDGVRPPDSFLDRRSHGMTAAEAARTAQQRYGGGKVLSVEPEGDGYRVKLVRNGDVRVVFIPNR